MLKIINLWKKYKKEFVLKDINLNIQKNSSLALVGESGAGKTTLSRLILGIDTPTKGDINIDNNSMSVVFQDYRNSVNPLFTIIEILKEPFWLRKITFSNERLEDLLKTFNLSKSLLDKYPHELSGGQLQRVCILRAILTKPSFLILDEAFSALDVSTKSRVVTYIKSLQKQQNLTILLITHDLEVATSLCENIKILFKGEVVESLKTNCLGQAQNQYTKLLIDSIIPLKIKETNE
ncbi:ABC transporter ATP-binding protein [Malaciobacter canalis]|uniref:ABC transporter ATP-binding protein n=1 Tax=Malaciobacter canalis TaxID=1912871 RepID=UPI00384BB067